MYYACRTIDFHCHYFSLSLSVFFIFLTLSSNDLIVSTPPAKHKCSEVFIQSPFWLSSYPALSWPSPSRPANLLLCGSFCPGFFLSWLWAFAQFLPYLWNNNPTTAFSSESQLKVQLLPNIFSPIFQSITSSPTQTSTTGQPWNDWTYKYGVAAVQFLAYVNTKRLISELINVNFEKEPKAMFNSSWVSAAESWEQFIWD